MLRGLEVLKGLDVLARSEHAAAKSLVSDLCAVFRLEFPILWHPCMLHEFG